MEELAKKETTAEEVARSVIDNPALLSQIFDGVSSENPRIKFKCAKALRTISEEHPELLYPTIDFFIDLLDNDNNILKWTAIDIVGNLTSVDSANKFDRIFKKYYGFLSDDSMITVAHIVDNSGKIAKAKPHLASAITGELLQIEQIPIKPRLTQECKNILLGKVIVAFGAYFDQITDKNSVISFVRRQLHNTRNSTKVKAERFLRKIE